MLLCAASWHGSKYSLYALLWDIRSIERPEAWRQSALLESNGGRPGPFCVGRIRLVWVFVGHRDLRRLPKEAVTCQGPRSCRSTSSRQAREKPLTEALAGGNRGPCIVIDKERKVSENQSPREICMLAMPIMSHSLGTASTVKLWTRSIPEENERIRTKSARYITTASSPLGELEAAHFACPNPFPRICPRHGVC